MKHDSRQDAGKRIAVTVHRVDLQPVLLARLRRFNKRLQQLHGGASPEAVHTFRIACRELLACRPLLQAVGPTRYWQKRVSKSIKVLNRLRDLQQMQERLVGESWLQVPMEKRIAQARKHWHRYQPEIQTESFSKALAVSAKALSKRDGQQAMSLLDAWCDQWRRSLRQVRKRLDIPDATDLQALHRLRIRYKRLRYLLELLLEAGAPLDVEISALKQWQTLLGDIEDYRVMAILAHKMGAPEEIGNRFALQAQAKAQAFMSRQHEFAQFLFTLDQEVVAYTG